MELARQGAALLYANGAQKVWLFGSVARGRPQDERSDIDLAVEGLPGNLFFRMLGELDQLLHCPVDLVEMETASHLLRENIMRHCVYFPREN
jgi:predicted nucleotidyltransferase